MTHKLNIGLVQTVCVVLACNLH